MKQNSAATQTELGLIGLLASLFALLIFLSFSMLPMVEACLLFSALTIIFLLVYFKDSLFVGLVASALVLTSYALYLLYGSLLRGIAAPVRLYFVLPWFPIIVCCFWLFVHRSSALSKQNEDLTERLADFATIDPLTGVNNLKAYGNTMPVYLSIARRYKLDLCLVTWQFVPSYAVPRAPDDETRKSLHQAMMNTVRDIENLLRNEDELYLVSETPYTFALILLMTKAADVDVVIERLQQVQTHPALSMRFGKSGGLEDGNHEHVTAQSMLDDAMQAITSESIHSFSKS